jgi:hypothetical protein
MFCSRITVLHEFEDYGLVKRFHGSAKQILLRKKKITKNTHVIYIHLRW